MHVDLLPDFVGLKVYGGPALMVAEVMFHGFERVRVHWSLRGIIYRQVDPPLLRTVRVLPSCAASVFS